MADQDTSERTNRLAAGEEGGAASAAPVRKLTPEAQRALAEAEERRRQRLDPARPKEVDGRGGLDPARYGDWEIKGVACDF